MTDAIVERPPAQDRAARDRVISVRVGAAVYGFAMDDVQEVIGLRPLTRVFLAPPAIAGVTNLRGEVLVVLGLSVILGGTPSEPAPDSRIVVVREPGGKKRRAGLLVDALDGLRDLPESGLEDPPSTLAEAVSSLVSGVISASPPCAVLDVSRVFDTPELAAFAQSPLGGTGD